MSERVHVDHDRNDRFTVLVRGHAVTVDQPVDKGGDDTAPTPTELFVAALAACVAFYARRYLARHGIAADGLAVDLDYTTGDRPSRVAGVEIRVTPPAGLPPERRAAFLAVASNCTLHHTLQDPPVVDIALAEPELRVAL